jgi:hypothetical protein
MMKKFSDKLKAHMESMGIGPYSIWKHFKPLPKQERLSEQYIYALCRGEKQPKDVDVLVKLSSVPCLNLDLDTLLSWKLQDEYSAKQIILAATTDEELISLLKELVPGVEVRKEVQQYSPSVEAR